MINQYQVWFLEGKFEDISVASDNYWKSKFVVKYKHFIRKAQKNHQMKTCKIKRLKAISSKS